jgi:23S rRNA (adenine2503-C2)-methyltransferase
MGNIDIKSLPFEELTQYLVSAGEPKYRAKQLYEWMHVKLATSFEEMTNLPKSMRQKLSEQTDYVTLKQLEVQTSKEDGTQKYLFELTDGNTIESVRMKYHHGISVCISSQAGCRMGCKFCASTMDGLARSLTASEMLEQIYAIERYSNDRVSNIVVMGMGEPFDNYDNLLTFLHMISDEHGQNISQRNLTVSTCGLVPEIRRFADEKLSVTLALSLHASNQKTREEMMPIAKKYPIDEVLDACRYFFAQTKRRVTFEYSLAAGVNDTKEDAAALAGLIGDMNCHVNLIPINPVRGRSYSQSDRTHIQNFLSYLESAGINATVRREMGRDIDGACGQLRKRFLN